MVLSQRLLIISGALVCSVAPAWAQVSTYYTTDGTAGPGFTHMFQGGSEVGNFAWAADGEMIIAVGNFGAGNAIRQAVGQPVSGGPEQGDEYTLAGVATGFHNLWNPGDPTITGYDAGYDGSHIFMVDWNGPTPGEVCTYDNNYGNRSALFMANPGDIGITFDSGTNTLWTSNFSTGLVQQWSMSGAAMASFFSPSGSAAALAYDSADGTLWMSDGFAGTSLYNFDRSGNLLQTVTSNEYLLGGEMAASPEPASFAALGIGVLAVMRRRRSRR